MSQYRNSFWEPYAEVKERRHTSAGCYGAVMLIALFVVTVTTFILGLLHWAGWV
jgi:hypothetical protein